jgi:hypothetical protein
MADTPPNGFRKLSDTNRVMFFVGTRIASDQWRLPLSISLFLP